MSNPHPQQTYNQYIVRNFSHGKHFGITLPQKIAKEVPNIKFNIQLIQSNDSITLNPGTYIVLKSGLDLAQLKKEIDNYDIADY